MVSDVKTISYRRTVIVLIVVTLTVFLLDIVLPLGINDGYFYAFSILATLWLPGKMSTIITSIVATVLIFIAHFISPKAQFTHNFEIANRFFAVMGVYITVFTVMINKQKAKIMRRQYVELKKKIEELKQLNSQLEQYTYVASHDLQEPLRNITNYITLLQNRIGKNTDKGLSGFVDIIVKSAEKMRTRIQNLLLFSQIGKERTIRKVNTRKVLDDVLADIEYSIKDNHAKIVAADLPEIECVESEIRQVFQNLIVNAIKFRKKEIPPEIHVSFDDKITEWHFSISDNGIGIEKQYFDKLFVIFQRLHSEDDYPGLGIGLAICKKIIELHGGKIWVTSKPGEGSVFHFTILKHEEQPAL
jgi:light-regulated signal transduction histidine kinase (bacteriophytochrome)